MEKVTWKHACILHKACKHISLRQVCGIQNVELTYFPVFITLKNESFYWAVRLTSYVAIILKKPPSCVSLVIVSLVSPREYRPETMCLCITISNDSNGSNCIQPIRGQETRSSMTLAIVVLHYAICSRGH